MRISPAIPILHATHPAATMSPERVAPTSSSRVEHHTVPPVHAHSRHFGPLSGIRTRANQKRDIAHGFLSGRNSLPWSQTRQQNVKRIADKPNILCLKGVHYDSLNPPGSTSAHGRHVGPCGRLDPAATVSYTHLRAHETVLDLVCR